MRSTLPGSLLIIGLLLYIMARGLNDVTAFSLRHEEKVSKHTLIETFPALAWLDWVWLMDLLLAVSMMFVCIRLWDVLEGRPGSVFLIVLIRTVPEAIHGLFAALSGIYIYSTRGNSGYCCVHEGKARLIGCQQFCLASILSVVAVLLAIVVPRS